VSPVPDPISRLVKIRCTFDQRPPSLPQETLLKAHVVIREVPALTAPSKALVVTNEDEFVFIRIPGEKPAFKKVKVHVSSRNKLEMALEPNDATVDGAEIVSDGALLLNDVLEGSG
jgi:hypothetical protein